MKSFIVDFNQRERGSIAENIDNLTLHIPDQTILFGLIKKEIAVCYYSIRIDNIIIDDAIEVSDMAALITLSTHTSQRKMHSNHLSDIEINTKDFQIEILLDKSVISDFRPSDDEYRKVISFDVVAQPNKNATELRKTYQFELVFIRSESEFLLNYEQESVYDYGLEYRKANKVLLGNLQLECTSDYHFSHPVNKCILSSISEVSHISGFVFLGSPDEIVCFDYVYGDEKKLKLASNDTHLEIYHIEPRTKIIVPVYIDLTQIANPIERTNYKATISIVYHKDGNEAIKSIKTDFGILPDSRETSLMRMIDDGGGYQQLSDSAVYLQNRLQWLGKSSKGKSVCCTIKLGNFAENGEGLVKIRNLSFSLNHTKDSLSPILNEEIDKSDSKEVSTYDKCLEEIFFINDERVGAVKTDYDFYNEEHSYKEFSLAFRFDSIAEIPNDIATIAFKISFEYELLAQDKQEGTRHFETTVFFKVEKNLGDDWLAIDFGTSAIVAAFANGDMLIRNRLNDLILDMQKILSQYVSKDEAGTTNEWGTRFLSSEMILRSANRESPVYLESTNYHNDIVHLSPSSDVMAQYSGRAIPYLKSLIGTDTIPDFSGELSKIKYALNPQNKDEISFAKRPIKVDEIISNVYNIIIRDFVSKGIAEKDKLNKVILTIPNTFTPYHTGIVKKLFISEFNNFKSDYIDFISESDAVACYYVANWEMMNRNRENYKEDLDKEEFVLVYDIGAGTTDITYLKISRSKEGYKELTVIGKFGKTTAGNYLDYTIANIIEVLANFNYTAVKASEIHTLREAKRIIKDEIKPLLDEEVTFTVTHNGEIVNSESNSDGFLFSTNDINNHDLMERYVYENSTDLFNKFFSLFNKLEVGTYETLEKGEIPLDTVIFTGRTAQYSKLRKAVEVELESWAKSPENIHYINQLDADELKTTVAMGALQYAMVYRNQLNSSVKITNRNIYARYGFLYKDFETGRWLFKEMLNPATRPIKSIPHKLDGITIYEYDTNVYNALPANEMPNIDLRNSPVGYFVQSFSPNTAQDINEHNWQYVSVMFTFSRDSVAGGSSGAHVPVRVVVSPQNEMIVRVGTFENDAQAPLKIDLKENETFKKSMWPFVM